MDTDTVSAAHPHEELLDKFRKKNIPILVGTQMVAKGLDFENVTLVQSNAAGEILEQLFRIGEEDVLIAITFPRYSKVTINTVKFARDRGATIVAVTDNDLSPIYQMADAALLAPCEMISFVDSMVAPVSILNALLVALANRVGRDVAATFAELEDIWNEYSVFGKMDDE